MNQKNIVIVNRILLGLLMLVPGIIKLFVYTPDGVVGNVTSKIILFAWAPVFWAWVLILSEIVFGIAIIINWKTKYTIWPPIVVLLVAAFTAHWADWGRIVMHLALVTNYLMLPKSK